MPHEVATPPEAPLEHTAEHPYADDHPAIPPSAPPATRRKIVFVGLLVPVLLITASVGIFFLLGRSEPARRPALGTDRASLLASLPAAEVQPVQSLELLDGVLDIHADGTVVPFREIQLAAQVSGQIVEKSPACEAGEFVKQGDLLLRIDPTDYELQVERLERAERQEYEALRELEQEILNTQKLIELAEQDVQLQQREIDRLRSLPQGFASQGELDQAERAKIQARNNLQTLENQLALAIRRRGRLEAAQQLAATQLKQARVDLERTAIRAPVDGVIVREDVEPNSFVSPGSMLVTIEETGRVEVAVNLRMDQLMWVLDQSREASLEDMAAVTAGRAYRLPQTRTTVEYRIAGREDTVLRWSGVLERYDGIGLDPTTRTVPVRIAVPEPADVDFFIGDQKQPVERNGLTALVRGMFVQVVIHTEPQTPLVLIPTVGMQPGNRVIQFQPDASVLDELREKVVAQNAAVAGAQAETAAGEAPSAAVAAVEDAAADNSAPAGEPALPFDPAQWVAGRAAMVAGILPITSSEVGESGNASEYWIVQAENLQAGDLVVVTPLGGLGVTQSLPVRVPAKQAKAAVADAASALRASR